MSETTRIYLTGSCEGFDKLREALAQQPGIEIVGSSEHPGAASGALQGGHLDCVLHATSSSTLPAHEIGTIREHTRVPLLLDRIRRGIVSARGCARRGRVGRPAAAGVDRERRLRNPEGDARAAPLGSRRAEGRPHHHGLLAEGRHGQDGDRDESRRGAVEGRRPAHAAARPRPAVRGRRDHARHRAGEDDLRLRQRSGRARPRQARRLHDEAQVGPRHPAGAASPGGRRARDRGEARPADRGRARNLRRDRRRHLAVLPRPDAGDARPHGRAAARVLPRRADVEERPARARDARDAVVPARTDSRAC